MTTERSADTLVSVARPKAIVRRDIVRRRHKQTWSDQFGIRRTKPTGLVGGQPTRGGRRLPTTVLALFDPDLPSQKCSGVSASGQACQRWAVVGGDRCHSHGATHRIGKRKPCSCGGYPFKHRAFSPNCWRERPALIMGPPKVDKPAGNISAFGMDWSKPYEPFGRTKPL